MSDFVIIPNDSDLQHHGIKGQKWGVRRYQNPDGSLTSAGRKRYGSQLKQDIDQKVSKSKIRNKLGMHITTKTSDADYKKASSEVKQSAKKMSRKYYETKDFMNEKVSEAYYDPKFRKTFETKMHDAFGNGVDDKDYFEKVKVDVAADALKTYMKGDKNVQSKFNEYQNLSKDYYSGIQNKAKELTKGYGDQKVSGLKKKQTYSDYVAGMLRDETFGSYLVGMDATKSFDKFVEDAARDNIDDMSSFTMDYYNKKYGGRDYYVHRA